MSYGSQGNYGTPPFNTTGNPNAVVQTPPQEFDMDNGAFKIRLTTPVWNERGAAARATFYAEHYLDGPVTSYTQALAVGILDKNGNAVLTSYITAGAVTADPAASGTYFAYITLNTIAPEGLYIIEWTGTYTPKAGGAALSLRFRRSFRVKATGKDSQFYFVGADQA